MTPKDRALKALRTVFANGRVDVLDVEMKKPFQSGWQHSTDSETKACYLFLVTDVNGTRYTAGCFFEDEFMELFDDAELEEAFRLRFVPKVP